MRDSPHPPTRPLFDAKPTPVVLRLIIANAAVWFLFSVFINLAQQAWVSDLFFGGLSLSPSKVLPGLQVWEVGTYMWLHELGSPWHLAMNMLGLFFLGPPLERRWGARPFLRFYILCGLIAGLITVAIGVLLPRWFGAPVIGASGSIMGLLAAFSLVVPNATILLFFVVPVQARYVIWIALGIDAMMFLSQPQGGIAYHTHLGGALGAWLLITGNWRPRLALSRLRALRHKRRHLRVVPGGRAPRHPGDRTLH